MWDMALGVMMITWSSVCAAASGSVVNVVARNREAEQRRPQGFCEDGTDRVRAAPAATAHRTGIPYRYAPASPQRAANRSATTENNAIMAEIEKGIMLLLSYLVD